MSIRTGVDKTGVIYEAWTRSCMAFIRRRDLEEEFRDFCGDWPAPIAGTASMIAAAPEVLATAKAALTFYDRAEIPHLPGEVQILDALSAAIAKAEGRDYPPFTPQDGNEP